jgi:hypothetical protein
MQEIHISLLRKPTLFEAAVSSTLFLGTIELVLKEILPPT